MMKGLNNARHFLHSDCVTEQKTVVLQKQDNEGFGFVLRGAKGERHHHHHHHHLIQHAPRDQPI